MLLTISHACGGAVELVLRSLRGGAEESRTVLTSGAGEKVRIDAGGTAEAAFRPYATPAGNEPHELAAPGTVRIAIERKFGEGNFVVRGAGGALAADAGSPEYPPNVKLFSFPYRETVTVEQAG